MASKRSAQMGFVQEQPPEKLEELAKAEIETVRREMGNRFRHPRYRPLTLMLYYPLPTLNGTTCPAGFFADVGPHKNEGDYSLIFQPAHAGETGAFFASEDYAETFAAKTQMITEAVQASYREGLQDRGARTAQVKWEADRYLDIHFPELDAPPVGIYMHSLSISTPPVELDAAVRVPSLGIAYKLSTTEIDPTIGKELLPAALVAAQVAIKKRIDLLFGHRFRNALAPDYHEVRGRSVDLFCLVITYLLAHHWFYPHSPLAYNALSLLEPDAEALKKIYWKHFWHPPVHNTRPLTHKSLPEILKLLHQDFLQLGSVYFGRSAYSECHQRYQIAINSALIALAGKVAFLRYHAVGRTLKLEQNGNKSRRNSQYIGLTALLSENLDVQLPVYFPAKIRDRLKLIRRGRFHTMHRNLYRHFQPGDPEGFARPRAKEVDWRVCSVVAGGALRTGGGHAIFECLDFDFYCTCQMLEAAYLKNFETARSGV